MGKCIRCGKKISGRKKFCKMCKKAKKREYFRRKYNNDEQFRKKHLNKVKIRKSTRTYLGSLYDYSAHARSDFEDEKRVVQSIKNKTFNGRKPKNKDDSFGYKANKNYNQAKNFEEDVKESTKTCEICGGDEFEVADGMIICKTCGLCEDLFSMSAFGKKELKEDKLIKAMKAYFKGCDIND